VPGIVVGVARAAQPQAMAERVELTGAIARADAHFAECGMERFEQFVTEAGSGFNRKVQIVRLVHNSECCGDFAVQEVSKEEIGRKADTSNVFEVSGQLSPFVHLNASFAILL
jgi:hypothetical protein